MRRLTPVLVVLLALLGVGGTAAPASAHASLVSSDPAEGEVLPTAPDQVTFTFSEPVSLVPDGVTVFDATGAEVETADASASDAVVTIDVPELDDGTYVVTWRIVSADSHPVAGSLTFHVGEPSEEVVAPQVAATSGGGPVGTVMAVVSGLNYLALLLAGGLVLFLGHTARGVRLHDDVRRRLARVLRGTVLAAAVTALVAVPVAGAYQQGLGLGGIVGADAWQPDLVRNELIVLGLQVLGLGVMALRLAQVVAGAAGLTVELLTALAVWSPALVGHTRAYEPATLLIVTDALHLSAGAVWLGGLAGLVLVLPSVRGRARDAALLLTRFSVVAAGVLLALAVTGTLMAWRILGSWSGLVEVAYGRLLLVKIAIALLVAAVAAWNRFRLLPGLQDGGHDTARRTVLRVRRTVSVEAVLLVAVLGVTGFLVEQPPGGESTAPVGASTGVVRGSADDVRVLAVLDEATGRRRQLTVQLQDETGEPVDLYQAPAVALSSDRVDLGEVPVVPVGAGTYTADVVFPHTGTWELRVSVRIDEFTTPVTSVDLEVR